MAAAPDKKAIVIGSVDGVPAQAICDALAACGMEVIFAVNQYFV